MFFKFMNYGNVLANVNTTLQQRNSRVDFVSFIVPLGIATFVCIITTLVFGIFIKKNRRIVLPWHKGIAFMTLILGLVHGALALIFY
ncbi:MAG: hypothetical protein V1739_01110 [Candidatus Omnitrophota bacterium]